MASEKITVSHRARTAARPEDVYALLAAGETWPRWSPITSFRLERAGSDGGEGVGAIRAWKTGVLSTIEEIVAADAPRHFAYTIVRCRSVNVRDYRADVRLEPDGDGTTIVWSGSFRPLIPGTGGFWRLAIGRLYRRFATGLASYAEGQ